MKKSMLFAVPLMAAVAMPALADVASADAQSKWSPYLSLKLGVGGSSMDNSQFDPTGLLAATAVGVSYDMGSTKLRGEFEFSFAYMGDSLDEDDGTTFLTADYDQSFISYMGNVYVDFLQDYRIKPFVGAGFGMMRAREDISVYERVTFAPGSHWNYIAAENGVALALHAGFGFNFTERFGGELAARYTLGFYDAVDISIFSGTFGLRYNF